jgi:hypothetical protein
MNFQMKTLAAACALAATQSALALPSNTTITNTVFLSGSSALAKDVHNEIVGTLCTANSASLYTDTAGALGKDFAYYTCSSNISGLSGPIGIAYRTNGGSFVGGAPVGTQAIGLFKTDVASMAAAGCPADNPVTTGPSPAVGSPACSGWLAASASTFGTTQIPDIGIQDEEPALFGLAQNQPTDFSSPFGDPVVYPGSKTAKNFNSTPVLVQAMGVVASTPFLSALTAANALTRDGHPNMQTSWLATAFTAGASVQTDGADNPNNNGIGDWTPLGDLVASATGVTSAAFSGSVIICRRAPGSGTQASLQAKFLNIGCNASTNTPTSPTFNTTLDTNGVVVNASNPALVGVLVTSAGAPKGGGGYYEVYNNTSSGAVITCMQQAASAGLLALGVLSVDQGTKPGYDFLAIDGVYPTDASVTNGSYQDIVESVINTATGLSTVKSQIATALVTAAQTLTTQSPAGVYNVYTSATTGLIRGTTLPKSMKGSIAGLTCKKPLF